MNEIIKKNGITYGIILGVFSILTTAVIYAIDLSLFTNMWLGVISIIIYITIGVLVVSNTKKQLKFITFKDAFTVYFLAAVIGTVISTLFNMLLFNVIDPAAKETIRELTTKYAVEMMQKFGAPAQAINEAAAEMEKTDNFAPLTLLKGMLFTFVFNAVFGVILGLIFKSRPAENL